MKRRNAECGKLRRPIKRNKIGEGMYGSTTILYMKFLILWAIVITADFMFMFRFEFLWPFWLLLRSVHDSFKYKGLAFSVLFVCIAITSDLVCLFFIPVHWLLFAASTYVWVQYVWHTDKGICLPTIILWMLFVYLEAGIRWKDSRHMPHLDLCRPFAAHCIGYPVVTLGFGFKSYVGYRMRQRKQREVAKENEFYMQLLQQALPPDEALDDLQNLSVNGSVVSTASALSSASPSLGAAQTVHSNSITVEHHGDDKSHIGHSNPSQTTAIQHHASLPSNHHQHHHHHNNFNSSSSGSSSRNAQTSSKVNHISNSLSTTTANGHVGNSLNVSLTSVNSSRSQRRSVDKEKNDPSHQQTSSANSIPNATSSKSANGSSAGDAVANNTGGSAKSSSTSNPYVAQLSSNNGSQKDAKDKDSWDNCSLSTVSSGSSNSSVHSTKESKGSAVNNYEMTNGKYPSTAGDKKSQPNGNIAHYEVEEPVVAEPVEKVKGRRNRGKRDTQGSSKDNHSNHNGSSGLASHQQANSNHHNHQNNQQQHKDSTTSLDSSTSSSSSLSSSASAAAATISNVASQIVSKVCETCLRLEAEIKKHRNEISHMKQIENELRQKMESNAISKSCLQAKQRENDEMEKRIQELTSCRQSDVMNLQSVERRLTDERRQRQSMEAQLNNEKKARKLAEEKANRAECSEQCKQRRMQLEQEIKQLRRELKAIEDAKLVAEQQGRKFEQELRMFEVEVRNREAQQGKEVLMSALAAMQDKNSTLEKNLSAETRVKLDLFSALGEAKRQLEIKDNMVRNKDEEVLDLKAKIAQLLAVMPNDSLCLPQCPTSASSMLRMNDTPPLQGPSSPIMNLGGPTHQQLMAAAAAAHQQKMNSRGGAGMVPNVATVVTSANCVANTVNSGGNVNANNALTQTASNLDPNATAYTPKNSSMVGGADA